MYDVKIVGFRYQLLTEVSITLESGGHVDFHT